jgi:hypothetical protein
MSWSTGDRVKRFSWLVGSYAERVMGLALVER